MIKKYTLFALLLVLVGLIQAKCDYSKVSLSSTYSCNVYKFTVNGMTDTCNHLDIKIFKSGGTTTIGPFTTAVFYQTFTDTGSYYVRVSIKNKCCGSDTLFYNLVRVTCKPAAKTCSWAPKRSAYFSAWDSCTGKTHKYSLNGYFGPMNSCYKYTWTVDGVVVGTGRMISYPVTKNGTYVFCIKATDTCTGCDTMICSSRLITCATAGAVNARLDAGIVIFPNPSQDQLTIQCTSKNSSYCIMDSKGSMVKSGQLILEISSIDVSELPRGIYSVSVITANRRVTQIQVLR
jgi:hypothetical protein